MGQFKSLPLAALLIAAALLGGAVDFAHAGPRTKPPQAAPFAAKNIDDCERFNEPLAYNACLASFGPMRQGGGAMVTPEVASDGDRAGPEGEKATTSSRYSRRNARYSRSSRSSRRSGRTSASFSVPDSIISGNSNSRR